MNGAEALLAARLEQRIIPGLERVHRALATLGHPERGFTAITVLGTNGKGSTAALLAAIAAAHGLVTGLYTSPHLVRVEERIRLAGVDIPGAQLAATITSLGDFPDLSYFETLTTAAVLEFARRRIDLAVLEAGLGGRWDAVNAVDAPVALLTNIGLDHQAWLGSTRTAIAAEKAAALRGSLAVVGAWDDEVESTIRAGAAPATRITLASDWVDLTPCADGVEITVAGLRVPARLPLAGAHQLANLRLAVAGVAALASLGLHPPLEAAALASGIAAVRWPGRLQWVRVADRNVLVDGAHNREAAESLARALDDMGLSGKVHLVFSCLGDKPLDAMAALLAPRAATVTVAPLASPRATDVTRLAAAFPGAVVADSIAAALTGAPGDGPILATGSLRTVGEVLRLAEEERDAR